MSFFFFLIIPPPPRPTLFPYTTLFRSLSVVQVRFSAANDAGSIGQMLGAATAEHPRPVVAASVLKSVCELDSIKLRSEEHTSELQSQSNLVCRLLLEKKKKKKIKKIDQ